LKRLFAASRFGSLLFVSEDTVGDSP